MKHWLLLNSSINKTGTWVKSSVTSFLLPFLTSEKLNLSDYIQSTVFHLKFYFICEFCFQSEYRKKGKAKYITEIWEQPVQTCNQWEEATVWAHFERLLVAVELRIIPTLKGKLVNQRPEIREDRKAWAGGVSNMQLLDLRLTRTLSWKIWTSKRNGPKTQVGKGGAKSGWDSWSIEKLLKIFLTRCKDQSKRWKRKHWAK